MIGNVAPKMDDMEMIQKCLNCELDDCINCLSLQNRKLRSYEKALDRKNKTNTIRVNTEYPEPVVKNVVIDDLDRAILKAYVDMATAKEIAIAVKTTTNLVSYRIRRKFGLPAPSDVTREQKENLVRQCWKNQ